MKILETVEEFDQFLKDAGSKLVVIDFFADWCGPCKMIAPKFLKMADDFKAEVEFAKVNVDENTETAEKEEISAMPTFKFYKNGAKMKSLEQERIKFLKKSRFINDDFGFQRGTKIFIIYYSKVFLGITDLSSVTIDRCWSTHNLQSKFDTPVKLISSVEGKMKELTTLKELNELLESSGVKLVVIDFFADWCGPCKIMGPKFEELAMKFPDVVFAKVNIERGKEPTKHYSITSIPHFKFFKGKKEVDNLRGADETILTQKIEKWQ
ncbi:hypothetical protein pdam_00006148 [Pocillopora damicornis]|uniref:Thioredoxin domain-containing protein n=2 Tax=Pocillopora damicornis TaxID=46731 RepID=A0A3M6TDS3_POCDA|nr:hypothetical protein pdam_00006148 [Pocillopora damicornis]